MENSTDTLNFKDNNVQVISLEMLEKSYKENDIYGKPLKGIYHYQLIQEIANIAEKNGLSYEIEEIFAAQNRNRTNPGVVLLPQVEEIYGERAVQAHILRRVYTTLRIKDYDNDELSTGIAIAYHQRGAQVAIGNLVKICHNQTILFADNMVQTYGVSKLDYNAVFGKVEQWLCKSEDLIINEREQIVKWKSIMIDYERVLNLIGFMNSLRVQYDSDNGLIHSNEIYPLNQSQINKFVEQVLVHFKTEQFISLWKLYNIATNLYKPQNMEIPNIINQNQKIVSILNQRFS